MSWKVGSSPSYLSPPQGASQEVTPVQVRALSDRGLSSPPGQKIEETTKKTGTSAFEKLKALVDQGQGGGIIKLQGKELFVSSEPAATAKKTHFLDRPLTKFLNTLQEKAIRKVSMHLFTEAAHDASREDIVALKGLAENLSQFTQLSSLKDKVMKDLDVKLQSLPETVSTPREESQAPAMPKPALQRSMREVLGWHKTNWEKMFPEKENPKVDLGSKGVKVMRGPDGTLSVQSAGKLLSYGALKKAKGVTVSFFDGQVKEMVRLASVRKSAAYRARFRTDIKGEIEWRDKMKAANGGRLPEGILDIQKFQYVGKKGEVKERYLSERCEGDISKLLYTRKEIAPYITRDVFDLSGKDKEGNPINKKSKVLTCYRDALKGLAFMHEHKIVHRDLKPENILHREGKGFLSDFGSAVNVGEQKDRGGTIGFMAPEVIRRPWDEYATSSDMFSFGMMLLEVIDNEAFSRLRDMQSGLIEGGQPGVSYEGYCKALEEIRGQLDQGDALSKMAGDLINLDPEVRPSSQQALTLLEGFSSPPEAALA